MYQIGLKSNLEEIQTDFEIFGLKNNEWHTFQKNESYDAFLITRKKS